jgi:hypothetical protein
MLPDPYRHYRRQMRRNWRTRHGRSPILIVDGYGYQPLGLIAAAFLGRLIYRHRSAFLPFLITTTAFAIAAIAHRHHPGLWAIAAALTLAAATFLGTPHRLLWASPTGRIKPGAIGRLWEVCGINRTAERAYAVTVITATGGWLSAAIAVGPTAKPLPAIAAITTIILGIPW